MGNLSCFDKLKQPEVNPNKTLHVATLNYCGIAYSPFEFYFIEHENDLQKISKIFRELIPRYIQNFEKSTFQWQVGKLEKYFKKGRYSNMFDIGVGIFWKNFITSKQFGDKWDLEFNKNKGDFKFTYTEAEKETVKLYDFIIYHALLSFVYSTDSFEEAIKNDPLQFIQKLKPLYEISFLDEKRKLAKFLDGLQKLNPDVFFIQEYSELLLNELRSSGKFHITIDPREDSLVLIKKSSFPKTVDFKDIIKEIDEEQKKSFKWGESIAFAGAENFIFICVHLSSQKEKNKGQIKNLKEALILLNKCLNKYEIIVGGDLNSFLEPDHDFSTIFKSYPQKEYEYTTIKRRTFAQSQFNKAEVEIKESKDKIISTLPITSGSLKFLSGEPHKGIMSYLPTNNHPHDHFICQATISK